MKKIEIEVDHNHLLWPSFVDKNHLPSMKKDEKKGSVFLVIDFIIPNRY
jgi:hypothetical protein